MLFTDNTSFLDNCADHMRAYFGIEDTDENISESVIGSVSECCNIGWDEKDGEYFRWEKGLTVCEIFEGLGESAILWHALLKLLGDNGGKTTHKYTRSFEIELPVGSGCIHKEEKQVSFNGNLFSEVLFPVMTALGKRNRRVSVSELVARLAKELDAAFDKKKEKLMDAIPLAEDAAYVWIRFSGYEPVTDGVEDKEKTAQRIAVQYAGGYCYEYVMRIYGQTVNYIDRIPQSERWLEENCGLEAPSVTIEEYENNVVCLSYDTEKALHGFKEIDGLIFLRAAASVSYQSGIQRIKKQMVNGVTADLTAKVNVALERARLSISLAVDGESLSSAEKDVEALARICTAAENICKAHFSARGIRDRADVVYFREMTKRALSELKLCRERCSVKRAESELKNDGEILDIKRTRLLNEIHEIEGYINAFEELYIKNAQSKEAVFNAMGELQEKLDMLDLLYSESVSADAKADRRGEGGLYVVCDTVRKKAESIKTVIKDMLKDQTLPDFSGGAMVDDSKWIYDLGDGVRAQFVLVDEAFNELVYEDESKETNFNFYDHGTYRRLTDSAIDVKRQPVFSDYPEFSTYAYFRPFKYQLDSVRTMLSRFEGRGIFGDQVGLGKTLQTLMAADVMYRCGSIANAVIVAREANIYQWRAEIESKFKRADGEQMFRLLPECGHGRLFYTVDELPAITSAEGFSKRESELKIYFLSSESLQSEEFAAKIDDIAEKKAELARITEHVDSLSEGYPLDENSINSASNIDTLFLIKKAIYGKLMTDVKNEQELLRWEYRGIRYGFDEFDPKLDNAVKENGDVRGRGFFPRLNEYNELIGLAASRMEGMILQSRRLRKAVNEFKLGSIGLLIFDEVQEIIDKINSTHGEKRSAEVIREFVADMDKKYCILLSATPIKNDLSDIFQLLYMVDKNRLGDTREEAENNFYRIYCGGCRTLSDIAVAPDREVKFKMLNGLINSLFTRKRLYDKDVIESMRRQCATAEERTAAKVCGRDDYGGKRFETLMRALSTAFKYSRCDDPEKKSELKLELSAYNSLVYGGFGMTDEAFVIAALDMSDYVVKATVQEELNEGNAMPDGDGVPELCGVFLENKKLLIQAEQVGDVNAIAVHRAVCDRAVSRINRGLIEYYSAEHDYSTVFIADCLDWTRPHKRGVYVSGVGSLKDKTDMFIDALSLGSEPQADDRIEAQYMRELKRGKIVFYDRSENMGLNVYRALKNGSGVGRRIYINLNDGHIENGLIGAEDMVYLNYFGAEGKAREISLAELERIRKKDRSELTFEEARYLDTYGNGDVELTHNDINFINFSEFSAENGNWNAVSFIDRAQTVGTDLDAANVLCIGQLDDGNGEYMDPLTLEQLIGRVSRLGQTEECFIFTCLYNGSDDGLELDGEFNAAYYELLTDPEGFDLFGAGMTELSFALPVVSVCLKQMLSDPVRGEIGTCELPERDFIARYYDTAEPFEGNESNFAEIFKYVYKNRNDIRIAERIGGSVTEYGAVEGVKRLIRKYVSLISVSGGNAGR